ncbi:MAG: hypothetical protein LAT55_11095, partial [Opitutales bacterium]|nr:hypothetical protein [Opitutales bacterium]
EWWSGDSVVGLALAQRRRGGDDRKRCDGKRLSRWPMETFVRSAEIHGRRFASEGPTETPVRRRFLVGGSLPPERIGRKFPNL